MARPRHVNILIGDGPCIGQWIKVYPSQRQGMPPYLYVCTPSPITETGIRYRRYSRVGDARSMRYTYLDDYVMQFDSTGSVQ